MKPLKEDNQQMTHLDANGEVKMVDISHKEPSQREAKATGYIILKRETIERIVNNQIKKGSVLTISKIAAIQSAKKCYDLIPLCHPIMINNIDIEFDIELTKVTVYAKVGCYSNTGVEMEALTAVSTALLTIYDMCKAIDKSMEIREIKLLSKTK